jgi:hypothetical protein
MLNENVRKISPFATALSLGASLVFQSVGVIGCELKVEISREAGFVPAT